MKRIFAIILVIFLFVSLISCGNDDVDIIKCANCGEENEITAKYCKSCGESISDENSSEEGNKGDDNNNETNTTEVVFDVSKLANISSQQLIAILGQPDNITQDTYYGFVEFPYTVYDYTHELGFLQIDLINDKTTAFTLIGELPYNSGNVLETLNVKNASDDNFSESDMYKKWECPTESIDLIHITTIDKGNDVYKQLSVEFDSRYYREWNLPIFYGNITPGEYSVQTQEFIKSLLDSPKSADFPMLDWEYARNDYYFLVKSYVDAKNGFGVEIRHTFSVVYFNDTSIMAYAIFDGIVVANNGYTPTENIIKDLFDSNNDNNTTPSNPSTDNKISVDDCVLYTEEDLPICIGNEDSVTINNITYYFESGSKDSLCNLFFTVYTDKTFSNDFYLNYTLYGDNDQNVIQRHELIDEYGEYQGEGNCIFSIELSDIPIDNYTFSFESIEIEGDSTPVIDLSQVTLTANTTLPIVINTPQGTIEIFELIDPMFMSGDSNETMVLGVLLGIKSDKTIEGVTLKITLTAVNLKTTEEYIIEDLTIHTEEDWISFFSGYFENAVLPIDDYVISFSVVN